MKKLRLAFIVILGVALSCQFVTARGWHHRGHHGEANDSTVDSTYHHRNHHHTDSIDFDSLYNDSVKIYHHGHHHFKNDSISYDSLRHDSTANHFHFNHDGNKPGHNDWNHGENWGFGNNWNHKAETDTFYVNNVLYVDSMTVAAGTTSAVLPIVLDNADDVYAVSFRLDLPDGITLATDEEGNVAVEMDTVRTSSTAKMHIQKTHEDDLIFQYTKRHNAINGNSGAIAYVTVNLADTLEAGDYTIELCGVQLTDKYSQKHRGYTSCSALTIAAQAKAAVNEETGINDVPVATKNDAAIYDISGRKVIAPKSGNVYIHNGKKYIVK